MANNTNNFKLMNTVDESLTPGTTIKSLSQSFPVKYYIDDLVSIDEAVGSRIYQRTKDYCNIIGRDKNRNWRLRK